MGKQSGKLLSPSNTQGVSNECTKNISHLATASQTRATRYLGYGEVVYTQLFYDM